MIERIKSIHIQKFRKFKNNTIYATQHNVLVGANNSGKTSILQALRLFFISLAGEFSGPSNNIKFHQRFISVEQILPVANEMELWTNCKIGSSAKTGISIEVEFDSGLKIEAIFRYQFGQVHVKANVNANPNNISGEGINSVLNHRIAFIPGLVGILPQEGYVTPARRSAMSIETRYSEMYRSSLIHLNSTDNKALKVINNVLKEHLGVEIIIVEFDPDKDVYVNIKYKQNDIELDLASAGSGMLQIIQLLVYIYLFRPTLLLIDEPDAHLHPELQEKLGSILKNVVEKMNAQLFLATHSPDVIDSFSSNEIFFIDANRKHLRPIKVDSTYVQNLIDSGIITNSSLSRIAVRPNCLVVEDRGIKTFQKIDAILNTKLFNSTGEYKKAEGVSKFKTIHEVYLTVQNLVEKKINISFIQDRDGLPDRYIGYIQKRYRDQNMKVHILKRHEIENYLLDGKIIRAALLTKGQDISLKKCRQLLIASAEKIKADARGDIRRKALQVNSFCNSPDRLTSAQIESDVDGWFDNITLNEATVLQVFPGKEILKTIRKMIADEYNVDLRENDLRNVLTRQRIGSDLQDIFKDIAKRN